MRGLVTLNHEIFVQSIQCEAYIGVVGLVSSILFTLPSGVWIDRYDRTRIMVLADVIRAGAMGALGLSIVLIGFRLPFVLVVMFVMGASSTLFGPAEQTLMPRIVPKENLARANGLNTSSRSVVGMVSTSAGGALVVFLGAALSILYNSLTFVISALFIFSVYVALRSADSGVSRTPKKHKMWEEVGDGFRWLIHKAPGLWELSISALFINFFSSFYTFFVVVYVAEALHGTAFIFGLFLATATGGMAAGSLTGGKANAIRHAGKVWILVTGVGAGIALLALAFATNLWIALPLVFAFNLAMGFSGNTWLTAAQRLVPSEMQGRYFTIDALLSWVVIPVAQISGGFLIVSHGIIFAVEVAGIGLIVSGLLSLAGRNLWRLGVHEEPREAANPS